MLSNRRPFIVVCLAEEHHIDSIRQPAPIEVQDAEAVKPAAGVVDRKRGIEAGFADLRETSEKVSIFSEDEPLIKASHFLECTFAYEYELSGALAVLEH